MKNDNICTYFVLSLMSSFLGCYHLCFHLMLSFFTVSKWYHFYVIIFPCTYFVLLFMLSFDVIIYCYHFPPFFSFSWKRDTLRAKPHLISDAHAEHTRKELMRMLSMRISSLRICSACASVPYAHAQHAFKGPLSNF